MRFTYYGQSCFNLEIGGKNCLFDPFIRPNPLAAGINVSALRADYIFLSHGHADHVADAEEIAKNSGALIIANYEVATWFETKGVERIHPMNTGGKWNFDFGTVHTVNAVHSSSMPDGSYGGNPMGFVLTGFGKNIYYSGDTALTMDMQLIPFIASIDCCILPIGDNFTMGPEAASRAATMIQCNAVIGVHFDTFDYIKIDHQEAVSIFKQNGQDLKLPEIGVPFEI